MRRTLKRTVEFLEEMKGRDLEETHVGQRKERKKPGEREETRVTSVSMQLVQFAFIFG